MWGRRRFDLPPGGENPSVAHPEHVPLAPSLGLIGSVADTVEQRLPADGVGFELWMCFRFGGT